MFKKAILLSLVLILVMAVWVRCQEFRRINPIPTPVAVPEGARPVSKVEEVDPQKAISCVHKVFSSWNKGEIERHLASDFYDKTRFLDAMRDPSKVPADAKARILSVGAVQTLNQYERALPNGKEKISIISVTATSQIEFNDPQKGFRRLEGTNEYIFRVIEKEVEE